MHDIGLCTTELEEEYLNIKTKTCNSTVDNGTLLLCGVVRRISGNRYTVKTDISNCQKMLK